jgi:hypothetical protein
MLLSVLSCTMEVMLSPDIFMKTYSVAEEIYALKMSYSN